MSQSESESDSGTGRHAATNDHSPVSLGNGSTAIIRHNCSTIVGLPNPEETWTVHDLDTRPSKSVMDQLASYGILVGEGYRAHPDRLKNRHRVYRVHPHAYEHAQEYVTKIDTLPCCGEGTGFRNEGGDLCCLACGTPHSREVITEVLG